jgi:hypothetical protein
MTELISTACTLSIPNSKALRTSRPPPDPITSARPRGAAL